MNGPRVPAVAEGMAYAVLRMALILCVLAGATTIAVARTAPGALPEMALAALPREAQEVYALIGRGGPFHYDRDGVVFGNREGLLPERPRGYYREYTVRTAPHLRRAGADPGRVFLHR
jgi:ribonuclease T1